MPSLDWEIPKKINKSKIMLVSSFWVFLVPLIIKLTDSTIASLDTYEVYQLDIPVSLNILYFSGVSFFIGSLLFIFFCPSVIKEYESEKSFRNSDGSNSSLQYHVNSSDNSNSQELKKRLKLVVNEAKSNEIDKGMAFYLEIGSDKLTFNFHKDRLNDVFSVFYYFSLETRFKRLLLTIFFYVLGFLGVFYVFLSNLITVINSLI